MKKTVLVLLIFPLSLFSQEEILTKREINQNSVVDELNLLYNETGIFNLHPEVLEAEQSVKYLLPTTKILFSDIRLLPAVSENFARSVLKYRNDLTTLTHFGFRMTGNIAGGFGPPLPGVPPSEVLIQTPHQLEEYLNQLRNKIDFQFADDVGQKNWDKLSFKFQSALVKFLMACTTAEPILHDFISAQNIVFSGTESPEDVYEKLIDPWQKRQLDNFSVLESLKEVDLAKLAFCNRIINENLRSFLQVSETSVDCQHFEIETKYGSIGIFGNQKDTISKNYFISLDFGGDDLYTNNCGSNMPLKNEIGLLVDYSGNDVYKSDFINAGILGLSFLLDFGGNDEYKNSKPGLAFSLFGSSVFTDFDGDDLYVSSGIYSQGSAVAGVSVFIDQKGTDRYFCKNYSQGFGGTLGCGILLDVAGNDIFKGAMPGENEPDFASFIQGASRGRWAEAADGQSLAGGFGIFIDGDGADTCFAGSFSQGAAYYFGTGMFNDITGNDAYNAVSHSQGYGVHFALGNFCDFTGDDNYNAKTEQSKITQIIGSGRDNSCGIFCDKTGNDSYYFGNRSAGIGDMRGFGCFFDDSGENSFYQISNDLNSGSPSLGKAVSSIHPANEFRLFSKELNWNSGIFISKNGVNRFFQVLGEDPSEIQHINKNSTDSVLKLSQVFLIDK